MSTSESAPTPDVSFEELVSTSVPRDPGPREQGRAHRRWIAPVSIIATVAVLAGGYVGAAAAAPLPAPVVTLTTDSVGLTEQAPPLNPVWPGTASPGATGAVGILGSQQVTGADGADQARPMASLSKVVTALVLLSEHPLGDTDTGPGITLTAEDMTSYRSLRAQGGVVLPVSVGQSITQRELMTGMMLESANNYAETLVRWAFGSVDAFLVATSAWLAEQKLSTVSMADPHGMSTLNVASAIDLVAIGKLALDNPFLAATVGLPNATIPLGGDLVNTNGLVGTDGFRGIKTGTTNAAGYCLLFARDVAFGDTTTTTVGVIMGADSQALRSSAAVDLAHSAQQAFAEATLVTEGDVLGEVTSAWGDKIDITAAGSLSELLWNGATASVDITEGKHPEVLAAGDIVGTVRLESGSTGETSANLVMEKDLTDPGLAWRIRHPAELWAAWVGN